MSLSKSGYIKAVAVHMKTSLGRPMENAEEIVRQVKQYEAKNPDLIVFGELSISGYSCGDLFLQSFMEEQCRMAITYLCDNLPQSDTLIAVGAPLRKDGMLFNTALIFKGNELLGIVPKTFVPIIRSSTKRDGLQEQISVFQIRFAMMRFSMMKALH